MSNEVISTRVRLARNLKDYPFPCRLSEQGRKKVIEKVTSAIRDSNSSIASDFNLIKLDDLTEAQGVSLVERHLVSPEFISETEGRALLLSKDERHLALLPGARGSVSDAAPRQKRER